MKKLFQILFFVLYPLIIYSQDSLPLNTLDSNKAELKRHTLFLELGGSTFYYSLKYDYILKQWKKFSINYDIGFSILPASNYRKINSYREIRLPMQLSGLYGKSKNKLEFGVFILFEVSIPSKKERVYDNEKTGYSFEKGIEIGYRFQKKQGGLFFKAYFLASYFENGLYERNSFTNYFSPWMGIGIGYTFK